MINALQGDFPVLEAPFAAVGASLGLTESEVIQRLQALLDDHVLTRFGPMFQIERMGGAFCLAAMAVPEADWQRVVDAVNDAPEVAHNYRREHALNMWFVLATEAPEGIAACARRIEALTALDGAPVSERTRVFCRDEAGGLMNLVDTAPASEAELDRRIVLATQGGLPLVPRPYAAVAERVASDEATVRARLLAMLADGRIRRWVCPITTPLVTPQTA